MKVKEESKKADLKLNIEKTKIMAPSPITSWQIDGGKVKTLTDSVFLDSRIIMHSDCSHEIRTLAPSKESYDKSRQHCKKQRHHFVHKGPSSQSCGFSSSHVQMDHKEDWALKN